MRRLTLPWLLGAALASCGGDDSGSGGAGLPSIAGQDLVGVWYDTEQSGRASFRATMRVDGSDVVMETTRSPGATAR